MFSRKREIHTSSIVLEILGELSYFNKKVILKEKELAKTLRKKSTQEIKLTAINYFNL